MTLSDHQEFGRAFIEILSECRLFEGLWPPTAQGAGREQVWMSHGDKVDALPPGFRAVAASEGAPYAAIADDERRFYGVVFHPEVAHTPEGGRLLPVHPSCRRLPRRVDDGGLPRPGSGAHPRAGGESPGCVRALGRG